MKIDRIYTNRSVETWNQASAGQPSESDGFTEHASDEIRFVGQKEVQKVWIESRFHYAARISIGLQKAKQSIRRHLRIMQHVSISV